MTVERRFVDAAELRMEDGEQPKIYGYAAVFNSVSEDLGGFREMIAPGTFGKTLNADVRALWNHDPNHVLGRSKSGTLAMAEDARGLRVEISPPASAAPLIESMKRGDVDQMSFAFRTISDEWRMDDGMPLRILHEVQLMDVSVVTYPAYPETDAAVRSLEQFRRKTAPDFSAVKARLRLAELGL